MPSQYKKPILILALLLLAGSAAASSHVEMDIDQKGTGFVGGQLVDDSDGLDRTDPIKLTISMNNSEYDPSQIRGSDFEFSEGLSNPKVSIENSPKDNKTALTLTASVDSYFEGPIEITFNKSSFDNASITKSINPRIYQWSAEKVGSANPGRDLTYEQVEDGEYTFYLDVGYRGSSNLPEDPLSNNNFRLTVKALEEGNDEFLDTEPVTALEDVDFTKRTWMKESQPSSNENYNYEVTLDDMDKLDELPAGKYRFILEVGYPASPENENVFFEVDKTQIDKSSEFSGAVRDSTGSGVRTEMLLQGNKNTRINTGDDGIFSTSIDDSNFESITARFFDRGKDSSDSTMVLDSPTLSENSDLGLGSAAMRYQYWNNPDNRIDGLESVNMMATKFAYPIDGVDSLDMAFDSGEVNLEKLQVYKCNFWNFDGVECMENWEKVSESNVNVNYASLKVNIDGVEPYTTPTDDPILMHSFIVGKRSNLQLQESISLETTELSYNGELGVSGVLVDESGERVEDADVELSLRDTDQVWNVTTDSTGTFRFDNKVQAEPGNYVLELNAEKAPYNSFSMASDATLQVSYEKGLETDAPADQTISQGETTSLQFEVTNTGQTEVSSMDVSVSGVKDQYIESVDSPQSIESGGTETVTVNLALPDDYCSDTCYPELNADVEGEAEGETVTASALLTTTLEVESNNNQDNSTEDEESSDNDSSGSEDDNTTENTSSTRPENETNSISGAFTEAQRMTGEFVERQSDLNIALGLIMIFTLILAAAVKKKKTQGGDGRGGRMEDRSRPNIAGGASSADSRVQRPDVSSKQRNKPQKVQEADQEPEVEEESESETVEEDSEPIVEEIDEDEEASDDNTDSEDEEVPDDVCDVCGEEFESATGVKIHKQAVH